MNTIIDFCLKNKCDFKIDSAFSEGYRLHIMIYTKDRQGGVSEVLYTDIGNVFYEIIENAIEWIVEREKLL